MNISKYVRIVAIAIYVSALCTSNHAAAQLSAIESCLGVLKYSKVTQTEARVVSSYKEIQSDYCDVQSRARSLDSNASFNAKWKVLDAGMSRASSSSQETYSKFCNENGTIKSDDESRYSVAESLSPEAFAAFKSCVEMHANEVAFDLANISMRAMEFNIPVSFAPKDANAATLTYTLTRDNTDGGESYCNWGESEETAVNGDKVEMRAQSQTSLKCSRDETATGDIIDIHIQRVDSSVGGMVFRWTAHERQADGKWLEVDKVGELENKISSLTTGLDVLRQVFAEQQDTLRALTSFRESHAHVPLPKKMQWHDVKDQRIAGAQRQPRGFGLSRMLSNDRDYAIVVFVASEAAEDGHYCELEFSINESKFRGPIGGRSQFATCEMSMLVPPRTSYQVRYKHSILNWYELY